MAEVLNEATEAAFRINAHSSLKANFLPPVKLLLLSRSFSTELRSCRNLFINMASINPTNLPTKLLHNLTF